MSAKTITYSEISNTAEEVLSKCSERIERDDLKEWLQDITKNTSSTLLLISEIEGNVKKLELVMSAKQLHSVYKNKVKTYFKIKAYAFLLDNILLTKIVQPQEDQQLILQICFDSVMKELYEYSEGMDKIVNELMGQ